MPWRIISGLVALVVLANANAQSERSRQSTVGSREQWNLWKTLSDNMIDIDVETERNNAAPDQTWEDLEVMSGSGSGMDTDDEDLLSASGSGSGAGIVDVIDTFTYPRPTITPVRTTSIPTTTTTPAATTITTPTLRPTTDKHLSLCQRLRENSRHLPGDYVPECDDNGNYHVMQCHGLKEPGSCWCADLRGREIPGTLLTDDIPDCLGGTNLARCVFQLVWQVRTPGLSTFRPRCTATGDFEATQCKGDICYCVDQKFGDKVAGTEVFLPDRPVCTGTTTPQKEEDVNERIEEDIVKEIDDKAEARGTMFTTEEPRTTPKMPAEAKADINIILIIGGSVVLLLCAILLALFIIYRMKKKDEGSYPLDEPKKMPNYTYQHVPEKEFYA